MLAGAIARIIEHRPRRGLPAKRLVVAAISPSGRIGLAFGQDRDPGVVPAQSLGAQHSLEALEQRCQRRRAAADVVGQGR